LTVVRWMAMSEEYHTWHNVLTRIDRSPEV
jgi:hypothetical protein